MKSNLTKDNLTLFGNGFVGSNFAQAYPNTKIQPRNSLKSSTSNILYTCSTTDNYNVYTNPFLDIETNLTHLIRVLEKSREEFGDDFIFTFISSWFVYGAVDGIATEESCCNPTGFYSSTKLCAEKLLQSYCETFGIRYQILRLGNVVGDDKRATLQKNAFVHLSREIIQNRDVEIYDTPSYRDFIDVRDMVSAIALCVERGKNIVEGGVYPIYNIGNGQSWNVKELLYKVHFLSKSTGKIEQIPVPEFHKIVQVPVFKMSNQKIVNLGYSPRYSMDDSIDYLIETYKVK